MSKRRLIGLASLLATIAFVAMPALAQATPHYYSELKILKAGVKTPVISWGTLKLTDTREPLQPIECENAAAGFVENPTGGGTGRGETEGWTAYNCKNLPECEAAGGHIAVLMENEATPGLVTSLKWRNELIEEEGKIKLSSTNVRVYWRCQTASLGVELHKVDGVHLERTTSEIELAGTVCTTNAGGGGALHPTLSNGNEAAKPSKVVFEPGEAGELACRHPEPSNPSEEVASKGQPSGSLKTMGYTAQETIATH